MLLTSSCLLSYFSNPLDRFLVFIYVRCWHLAVRGHVCFALHASEYKQASITGQTLITVFAGFCKGVQAPDSHQRNPWHVFLVNAIGSAELPALFCLSVIWLPAICRKSPVPEKAWTKLAACSCDLVCSTRLSGSRCPVVGGRAPHWYGKLYIAPGSLSQAY